MSYLDVTKDVYKEAALTPDVGLCCTTTPIWQFPGLKIPTIMQEMNYGCGSTVHPRDLINNPALKPHSFMFNSGALIIIYLKEQSVQLVLCLLFILAP